jgi:DNA-binding response OmpR family regulator
VRKILLIQKDVEFRDALAGYLRDFFDVQITHTTEAAWQAMPDWAPDIILIDDNSARAKSFDLLHDVRNSEQFRHVGLVVLTELDDANLEENLYLRGVDVVLKREIKPNALVLRLGALLQRIEGFQNLQDANLTIAGVTINPRSKSATYKGQRLDLTPTQYSLLFAFACHPNQVLTRKWMQQNIWKGSRVSPRSIDAQISKLKKIVPTLHDLIVNVYGEGYLLVLPKKAA